jgi:hypothetical protein
MCASGGVEARGDRPPGEVARRESSEAGVCGRDRDGDGDLSFPPSDMAWRESQEALVHGGDHDSALWHDSDRPAEVMTWSDTGGTHDENHWCLAHALMQVLQRNPPRDCKTHNPREDQPRDDHQFCMFL